MQSHRILSGVTVFLMVVLVAAGWFLVAQPQLAAADAARAQVQTVQSQITVTRAAIARLTADEKRLPAFQNQLFLLRSSIPSSANPSSYMDGLNSLAASSGVVITGITVGDGQAYLPPVATDPAQGFIPATDPAITQSNFVAIPVTITTSGTWDASFSFVKGLQTGKRLFLVSALSTTPSANVPGGIVTQIGGYIYAVLDPNAPPSSKGVAVAGEYAVGPPATTAPTTTPTPGATGTPSSGATPTPTRTP